MVLFYAVCEKNAYNGLKRKMIAFGIAFMTQC